MSLCINRVVAINPETNKMREIQLDLLLCTGCSGYGLCTKNPDSRTHGNKQHFRYAKCICDDQHEGLFTIFIGMSKQYFMLIY